MKTSERPVSNPASSQKSIEPENDGEMKMQKTAGGSFETPKVASQYTVSQQQDSKTLKSQSVVLATGSLIKVSEGAGLKLLKRSHANLDSTKTFILDDQSLPSDDHRMESTMFDYDQQCKGSENFGFKRYLKALFKGEIVDGKRQGFGVMIYEQATRLYEGVWAADQRNGQGYERYKNGNTYCGDFKDNKPSGKGVYTWRNGEVYDGQWYKGKKEGHGVWRGVHGDCYIGEWKGSKAEGYGVHLWKNGDKYEGEWSNCLKHGHGSDFFGNGDSFQGQYKYGKPDGFGQYKWRNGSFYIGDFRSGLKHGKGKWRKSNKPQSNSYEGEYYMDKKHGYGVFSWESGNMYKGNYKDDERDGYGEMYWTDGTVYKGDWRRGCQHGSGKMLQPDGTILEGYFNMNVFQGSCRPDNLYEESDAIEEDLHEDETKESVYTSEYQQSRRQVDEEDEHIAEEIKVDLPSNFDRYSRTSRRQPPYHDQIIPEDLAQSPILSKSRQSKLTRSRDSRLSHQSHMHPPAMLPQNQQQRTETKLKFPQLNSINDLQIQYVTDESAALNMSMHSRGDFLNRLNSKSALESSFLMIGGHGGNDEDLTHVFDKRNLMRPGSKLAPIVIPQIGIKKGMVSQQTLNLMKKRLIAGPQVGKWVPSGSKKQSKVFHTNAAHEGSPNGAVNRMSQLQKRSVIFS